MNEFLRCINITGTANYVQYGNVLGNLGTGTQETEMYQLISRTVSFDDLQNNGITFRKLKMIAQNVLDIKSASVTPMMRIWLLSESTLVKITDNHT